jgi:ketosteroid isomerase-like protein
VTNGNVEVVRRLFEAYAERGIEGVLETMDDDVLIEIPGDLSAEPDDYEGHDGARRYFDGFAGMLEDVRYEAIDVFPAGDDVIAHIRLSGRGASSGLDVDLEAFVVHQLANGKIVRIRPYADLESAQAATSGKPPSSC